MTKDDIVRILKSDTKRAQEFLKETTKFVVNKFKDAEGGLEIGAQFMLALSLAGSPESMAGIIVEYTSDKFFDRLKLTRQVIDMFSEQLKRYIEGMMSDTTLKLIEVTPQGIIGKEFDGKEENGLINLNFRIKFKFPDELD